MQIHDYPTNQFPIPAAPETHLDDKSSASEFIYNLERPVKSEVFNGYEPDSNAKPGGSPIFPVTPPHEESEEVEDKNSTIPPFLPNYGINPWNPITIPDRSLPVQTLNLGEDDFAYTLTGSSHGTFNKDISINKALNIPTTVGLFNALEYLENKLKYENPHTTTYKGTDNKQGTISAYAVQDFFTKSAAVYGIGWTPQTDIGFNWAVNYADKNGDYQLNLHEFKVATEIIEQEIQRKTGQRVNMFD